MLNRTRVATLVLSAVAASQCGGSPTAPTVPNSPATAGSLPVLRAITLSRLNVEAGDELTATATIEGTEVAGRLRYVWTVQPNAGALSPDGATLRWRAPADDPVPATYVFSVTLVETSRTTAAVAPTATAAQGAGVTSPPVTVNDARREMTIGSETFLHDVADATVSPTMCVRNFTDSCAGKQEALDEIAATRATYSTLSVKYDLQLFVRSIEWANCVAPDRSARCTLLIYNAEGTRTRRADNVSERVTGTQYVQGFYERSRWWLCGSRFEPGALPQ